MEKNRIPDAYCTYIVYNRAHGIPQCNVLDLPF